MAGVRFDKIFNTRSNTEGEVIAETQLVSGAKLIQSEIEFLLKTEKHTMFFGNNLGADLNKYLHLLNNQATYNLIKSELEDMFIRYRKVYLQKMSMNFNNLNKTLEINIEVSLDSRGTNIINIPLQLGG